MAELTDELVQAAQESPRAVVRPMTMNAIGLSLMMPLAACSREEKTMQNEVFLNVVLHSYLDRVIIDITFNGTDLGVANRYGGTGTMTGVRVPFGVQSLKWTLDGPEGMARNGEIVKMKNSLFLSPEQILPGTRYAGLHLYPDDTAEITFAEFIPERRTRGSASAAK